MNKLLMTGLACLMTSVYQAPAIADGTVAEQGGLIIYRDKESSLTRNANYTVFLDGKDAGRLKQDSSISSSLPAGEYRLSSSLDASTYTVLVVPEGETVTVRSSIAHRRDGPTVHFDILREEVTVN